MPRSAKNSGVTARDGAVSVRSPTRRSRSPGCAVVAAMLEPKVVAPRAVERRPAARFRAASGAVRAVDLDVRELSRIVVEHAAACERRRPGPSA